MARISSRSNPATSALTPGEQLGREPAQLAQILGVERSFQ